MAFYGIDAEFIMMFLAWFVCVYILWHFHRTGLNFYVKVKDSIEEILNSTSDDVIIRHLERKGYKVSK